jgi:hypothetical protein
LLVAQLILRVPITQPAGEFATLRSVRNRPVKD